MNATKLRTELYAVLDSVLETGRPVTIERKGRTLKLMLDESKPVAKRWPTPDPSLVNGDVDEILAIDWSREWNP